MLNDSDIRIYCFYYKPSVIPVEDSLYMPILAGSSLIDNQPGMMGDDTGISISEKNRYYSELTGIYWVWKNTSHKITGSCHYRRYFCACETEPFDLKIKRLLYYLIGQHKKRHGLIYTGNIKRFQRKILREKEIKEILNTYDAILPQKRKLRYTVKKHYSRYHNSSDLAIVENLLKSNCPEYLKAYHEMLNGKNLYANNMFILPFNHFNAFMNWWFSILFKFEEQINLGDYKEYQQRVLGFMAERLLTTWFLHQKLKVKELPVIYFKRLKYQIQN